MGAQRALRRLRRPPAAGRAARRRARPLQGVPGRDRPGDRRALVAGLAPTFEVLVVGRVLQGAGAAIAGPTGLALPAVLLRGERQARAFGLHSTVTELGAASGTVLSGLLTSAGEWWWSLLVNVPIGVVVTSRSPRACSGWLGPPRTGRHGATGAARDIGRAGRRARRGRRKGHRAAAAAPGLHRPRPRRRVPQPAAARLAPDRVPVLHQPVSRRAAPAQPGAHRTGDPAVRARAAGRHPGPPERVAGPRPEVRAVVGLVLVAAGFGWLSLLDGDSTYAADVLPAIVGVGLAIVPFTVIALSTSDPAAPASRRASSTAPRPSAARSARPYCRCRSPRARAGSPT